MTAFKEESTFSGTVVQEMMSAKAIKTNLEGDIEMITCHVTQSDGKRSISLSGSINIFEVFFVVTSTNSLADIFLPQYCDLEWLNSSIV